MLLLSDYAFAHEGVVKVLNCDRTRGQACGGHAGGCANENLVLSAFQRSGLGSEVRKWAMTWVLMLRLLTESVLKIVTPVMCRKCDW